MLREDAREVEFVGEAAALGDVADLPVAFQQQFCREVESALQLIAARRAAEELAEGQPEVRVRAADLGGFARKVPFLRGIFADRVGEVLQFLCLSVFLHH